MSKIIFVNPYNEDKKMTKTINPKAKGYTQYRYGRFTFEFSACCGRYFCLEKLGKKKYRFMTAYHPEDPLDWEEYDKDDFEVVE